MTLRAALAAAIASFAGDGSETVILDVDREEADAILSDAAFCIALTEAVEGALRWVEADNDRKTAATRSGWLRLETDARIVAIGVVALMLSPGK